MSLNIADEKGSRSTRYRNMGSQPSCHCSILLSPKYIYGPFSVKRAVDYEHHSMNSQRGSCP
eukprot:scaffold6437_cov98-Skeletonema_dohrnii-CCMP3373.AAC.4